MKPQSTTVQAMGVETVAVVYMPIGTPVVVASLTRVSWAAMVERTAHALVGGALAFSAGAFPDLIRHDAAKLLRAALALPPEWEPEG